MIGISDCHPGSFLMWKMSGKGMFLYEENL